MTIVISGSDGVDFPSLSQTLKAQHFAFARWIAADRTHVNADDPEAHALIEAIGEDPSVILAE